jgi:hypothetical protein
MTFKMPEPVIVIGYGHTDETLKQALHDVLEQAAQLCDRFQVRDVGMQPAECAGAIRAMIKEIE